jgi:polar amino acid transport system substrate-binding protein
MNRALEALDRDKIDGVIMPASRAYYSVDGYYAGKLKIITAPLTDIGLRLIALKTPASEVLISSFNETLKELKANGEYSALLTRWSFVDPATHYLKKP